MYRSTHAASASDVVYSMGREAFTCPILKLNPEVPEQSAAYAWAALAEYFCLDDIYKRIMISDWDGNKPDFRVAERVGCGHNSHFPPRRILGLA